MAERKAPTEYAPLAHDAAERTLDTFWPDFHGLSEHERFLVRVDFLDFCGAADTYASEYRRLIGPGIKTYAQCMVARAKRGW